MKALRIDTDGTITDLDLQVGDYLPSIQDAAGGWVECHTLGRDVLLWLDEDAPSKGAKLNGPVNHLVTRGAIGVRLNGVPHGPAVITGGESGEARELADDVAEVVRQNIAKAVTPPTGIRPMDGPHPDHVRDERGIRYPGQLAPESLVWEQHYGTWTAFYSGEDIGAYRPTSTGHEVRLAGWAPEQFRNRFTSTDDTQSETDAADMVLWNFNLYLRRQVADESGVSV